MLNRKQASLAGTTVEAADDRNGGVKLDLGKRQILFRAREPASSIYEVVSGALMVYRLLSDGRRQIVELVLPGSLCGFSCTGTNEGSCEALLASSVIAYEHAALESVDATTSRLAQKMEQQICGLAEHLVLLGRRGTEERLATFLVDCAEMWGAQRDEHGLVFQIPMTRVEIGDYLGMSLETVSRGIADFERRGLIRTGGRQGEMRIYDLAALSTAWRAQRTRRRHAT
jgi:CRP/FNR family transcriptional regulator